MWSGLWRRWGTIPVLPANDNGQAAWVCAAKGCRGRPQSPRLAPAGAIPPAAMKIKPHGCALRRGVGGDRRLRLFSLPPPRLRRGESPCNNKDQETWVCTAKGCRGRPQSPRLAPAGASPPATMKIKPHECALRRGVGGDRKAPDSRPQARNPLLTEKTSYDWKPCSSVAPIWRDTAQLVE